MAKKGMKRPDLTHTQPRNQMEPAPEIQGKAKRTKAKAKPIVGGSGGQKVYHTERPIPENVYPAIDTDLARDNVENDIPAADLDSL